ncbi:MAG: prefoldin subunit alpha [Candidatus Bathyarchaeota archaeon]|nr:MAG: prefoldin subunit alpha [Candidatus Bathyarchaeota archaeon]UCD39875.1 MAG: prefoldin subunit alpha [Candidatus Bathyarchaeota archaeon]
MSTSDETLRRLIVELRLLEGTANTLQSRLNLVNAMLTELNYAKLTLDGLEKEDDDASLFVPIGGGSYIRAKLESTEKIIVGMGAGISVEKSLSEAKETVGNRVAQLEKTRGTLQQQFTQVAQKMEEDQTKLQELSQKLRDSERKRNVQKT